MGLIIPEHYDPRLSVRETQEAIKYIRDTFQKEFGKEMNLERISAPLFVARSSGLNDNLNGVERPVHFDIAGVPGEEMEVVHGLTNVYIRIRRIYGDDGTVAIERGKDGGTKTTIRIKMGQEGKAHV